MQPTKSPHSVRMAKLSIKVVLIWDYTRQALFSPNIVIFTGFELKKTQNKQNSIKWGSTCFAPLEIKALKNDGHKRNHINTIQLFWKGLVEIVYYMFWPADVAVALNILFYICFSHFGWSTSGIGIVSRIILSDRAFTLRYGRVPCVLIRLV